MDYLRNEKQRKITIIGSKGSLECDFIKKYLKMSTNNGEILLIEEPHLFDVDESYKLELNHFIECIEKDRLPHITMNDGIEVLKLIGDGHV
jgi:predicted dehydrogenase